jgi:FkbM family methyltransferase
MIKPLVKKVMPPWLWTRLRLLRLRRQVEGFRPRRVRHSYGGTPLEIELADPLGQAWYDNDWPPLPEVELLSRHRLAPGALVFDLGAHQGVVALMLAQAVGPGGRVVAVEANPHNAAVARRNRDLNGAGQLHIIAAAVSDAPGRLTFNEGLDGQVDDGTGAWGRIEVEAVTIDGLAREHGPPDVLFLDVEGFECQALRGARETLARRPDAFVEVHVGFGLETFGGSVAEVLDHFPESHYDRFIAPDVPDRTFVPYRPDSPLLGQRFFLVAVGRGGVGGETTEVG